MDIFTVKEQSPPLGNTPTCLPGQQQKGTPHLEGVLSLESEDRALRAHPLGRS